ncbi:MAG: 2-phospho-L-lactate transferase [Alphaproteobacteria bacterium HGW-Alphaproteobacteria-13]|jgi:LPPG:FO 2-phospho-L-lactate transferase|nr:MAG: 2-phospho-L-lactate transferase [Alphaproteobacteria bacterium HGW-Alphaproteobacteria-13]
MILALAGGVGGAKLANGLAAILPPERLVIAVNTADDFEHLGFPVSPDIDTVTYTLAGINDPVQGWGIAGESWAFMDAVTALGGESWFRLGDRDLATHVRRRTLLRDHSLSAVTATIAGALGVRHAIVPMSDDPVRSLVRTDAGELAFQDYFVRHQCRPRFESIRFDGADAARPSPGLAAALADPALEAIILCPSNPILSIAPILAIPGVRDAILASPAPVVAVSPFIGGQAVKGPAAKIMAELGLATTPAAVIAQYDGLLDGLVIDRADADGATSAMFVTDTLMRGAADQRRLATETLDFARRLR